MLWKTATGLTYFWAWFFQWIQGANPHYSEIFLIRFTWNCIRASMLVTHALIIMVKGNSTIIWPNRRIARRRFHSTHFFSGIQGINSSHPSTHCFNCYSNAGAFHSTCKTIWVSQVKHNKMNNTFLKCSSLLFCLVKASLLFLFLFNISQVTSFQFLFCVGNVVLKDLWPPLALECSWHLLPLASPSPLASYYQTGQFAENKSIW